ncbi:MAG: hypothetical protein KatS3mg031_2947 [Chitinophagales bacterium]|nr:MAG: hypothetical protein KatS3mg031_2947 [Chitinophagales bacterium]
MIWLWLLFIYLEALRNFYIIEIKKMVPNYLESFIIRGIAAIVHGVLLHVQTWDDYKFIFVFQISSFYLTFDFILNWMRGKEMFFLGKNNAIDRFLRERPLLHIFVKTVALALTIFSLLKYYSHV